MGWRRGKDAGVATPSSGRRDGAAMDGNDIPIERLSHLLALLKAGITGLRALLTVVCLVLLAHITAFFANLCAQSADLVDKIASSCHRRGRQTTHLGAIQICPNAFHHFLRIRLVQACCCTKITCRSTTVACIDTGLILFIAHKISPTSGE